jgi:hypothetical protein
LLVAVELLVQELEVLAPAPVELVVLEQEHSQ